ncbi:calcium/sodium antiporter, partial [Candidatus Woesearchaeota archaeon]|nr:calcium/sodium antiporter [Candidatus Woesearchaeota archaeon]
GLTVVAIGTSLPELASSVVAALEKYPGLVTGNIVGSNIANIGLIIGIAAIMKVLHTKKSTYVRDSYFLLLSVILFLYFSLDGGVTRLEGFVLLVIYATYILFLYKTRKRNSHYKFRDYLSFLFNFEYLTTIKSAVIRKAAKKEDKQVDKKTLTLFHESLVADVLIIILSGAAIVFGAKFFIEEAVWLAGFLNLPTNLIGLTVVAIGTSLPELIVSIKAARKGLGGLVIGNVIGSNIANTFFIFGVASFITPIPLSEISILYTIPLMAFFTLLFVYLIKAKHKISKWSGIILLLLYITFIIYAFSNGWT